MITLTEKAVAKVQDFFKTETEAKGKSFRIGVQEGGCAGFKYVMAFDDKREGDTELPYDGFAVLVDSKSAEHLKGTVIDYNDEATQGGFKISNPNFKHSCGCGESQG